MSDSKIIPITGILAVNFLEFGSNKSGVYCNFQVQHRSSKEAVLLGLINENETTAIESMIQSQLEFTAQEYKLDRSLEKKARIMETHDRYINTAILRFKE